MADNDNNVVILDVETSLDIPIKRVIDGLEDEDYDTILVIGYKHGEGFDFRSSTGDIGRLLLMMERTKIRLME